MDDTTHCTYFPTCSGCSLIGVDYQDQLDEKLAAVESTFDDFGPDLLGPELPLSIAASPSQIAYRNRVKLVPSRRQRSEGPLQDPQAEIALGLYKQGSHEVIDIPGCPVQLPGINRAVEAVRSAVEKFGIAIYDESNHTGDLRFVSVREGSATGEVLVTLVTRTDDLPCSASIASHLMSTCDSVVGVVQNINPEPGNVIFGPATRVLAGKESLTERVCDVSIRLGATSFFQANTGMAELAYETMIASLELQQDDTLLDLYAGVGTIGLIASSHVGKVIAIESIPEAVSLGRASAEDNDIANAEFKLGPVEDHLPQFAADHAKSGGKADNLAVAVNPPRKGIKPQTINLLAELSPRKIAYLSCWPFSLVRDLSRLTKSGFRLTNIECFDMFPQTPQVETLAILERE